MNHRHWIVLFMVGIPALLLLVVVLFSYWRDKRRLGRLGRMKTGRRRKPR